MAGESWFENLTLSFLMFRYIPTSGQLFAQHAANYFYIEGHKRLLMNIKKKTRKQIIKQY